MSATPTTIEDFLSLIRKSDTIPLQRLDEYLSGLRDQEALPAEPKTLAALLVRDGLLTYFQAEQFLAGRWRGFTLGKYRLLERLGAGGMGLVFLGEHTVMRHRVALKLLPSKQATDPVAFARFQREARAAAGLDHPHLVRAFDIDQDDGRHFLVLEFVDGASLQEIVDKSGPLSVERAAHYVQQAALGLQCAYEAGLVHRDVKPGNLLLDRYGTVKVADLGLARFFDDDSDGLTREHDNGAILGSADYFAPEQALDSHEVDIRGDIYALGCTLYFLLAGRPPFQEGTVTQKLLWHQLKAPPPIRELRPEVPAELAAVLDRMTAKQPADRYQAPADVADALDPWTQTPLELPTEEELRRLSPAALGTGSGAGGSGPRPPGSSRVPLSRTRKPSVDARDTMSPRSLPTPSPKRKASAARAGDDFAWSELDNGLASSAGDTETDNARSNSSERLRADAGASTGRSGWWRSRWGLGALLGALVLGLGGAGLWRLKSKHGAVQPSVPPLPSEEAVRTPTPVVNRSHPIRLIRSRTQQEESFATLWSAIGKAEPNDRIVIVADVFEEALVLRGDGTVGRDLVLEGRTASGGPVLWRAPAQQAKEQALVSVGGTAGLQMRGFILDGQNRVNDLVVLSEHCPGLTLQDVQLKGFLRSAVKLRNCTGDRLRPVVLQRLAVAPGQEAETALLFESRAKESNEHIHVLDSRFVGPCKAAVRMTGAMTDVVFRGNRFFRGGDAFLFKMAAAAPRLHLALVANTFADFERGLHWEQAPATAYGNRIALHNNLFLRTKTLAVTDGISTQPSSTSAQWIWADENKVAGGSAPAGNRFFRKTFELPAGARTRGLLEIACDDHCLVWLNGVQVGRSPHPFFTRRVCTFDVAPQLRSGPNVLTVQGTNNLDFVTNAGTSAGLLVQLTCTVAGKDEVIVSDPTWKVSAKGPAGWQQLKFDDRSWNVVTVQGGYNSKESGTSRSNLVWDSAVEQHAKGVVWSRLVASSGNVRNGACAEGCPPLETRYGNFNLPTDPANDDEFLRYPASSPLAQAGPDRTPVGVSPRAAAPTGPAVFLLAQDGQEYPFPTVREALLKARPNNRVLVRGEVLHEALALSGSDGFAGDVVLEGAASSGKPVLWRPPPGHSVQRPLVQLANVTGLHIKGFLLDGFDQVENAVVLSGNCPGLTLEDLHVRGFVRSAFQLTGLAGSDSRPVVFRRVRTSTLLGCESALTLEARPDQVNRFLHIHDCRFEGPCAAAVVVAGSVAEVELRHNRFYQAADGLLCKQAPARRRLHLAVANNTFCDVQRILHLEALPAAGQENQLVVRDNLFARAARLVEIDGFAPESKKTAAQWIWFPETGDPLKQAPAEGRLFRKTFDLPKDLLSRGTLNIVCDDAFTVWLNGKEVGKGQNSSNRRYVHAFNVAKHLQTGRNVLAVEGRNHQGPAGLLVQLTVGPQDKTRHLVSDETWRTVKTAPQDWREMSFDDGAWQPVRVLTPYSKPQGAWRHFIWHSVVPGQAKSALWPLFTPTSTGNVSCKGAAITSWYTFLDVRGAGSDTALGTDPDNEALFLRYRKMDPLAHAGTGKTAVGVPPVE